MKKMLFILIIALVPCMLYAFTDLELQLAHNPEFALYQKLQLDTVEARLSDNSKVVLAELAQRDLIPTMNISTLSYYANFNESINDMKMVDVQRERLEYLHNAKQKSNLLSLVPNAFSMGVTALTAGKKNPLSMIISIAGAVVSSTVNYLSQKDAINLEYIQAKWELDDAQMRNLNTLGINQYQYKSEIAQSLGIDKSNSLSNDDLESFVRIKKIEDAKVRFIRLQSLGESGRLALLPEYWAEMAKTAYELKFYNDSLNYIEIFEEIYESVFYHDSDYAYLLMIKTFCINETDKTNERYSRLVSEADKILQNISVEDWLTKYYCACLYIDMYRNSSNEAFLEKAYTCLCDILVFAIDDYETNIRLYLTGKYVNAGLSQINTEIRNIENRLPSLQEKVNNYKGSKKTNAFLIYKKELSDAEESLKDWKQKKEDFKKTSGLILPPSSDFLCSLATELSSIAFKLGKENDSKFIINMDEIKRISASDVYIAKKVLNSKNTSKPVMAKLSANGLPWLNLFWLGISDSMSKTTFAFQIALSDLHVLEEFGGTELLLDKSAFVIIITSLEGKKNEFQIDGLDWEIIRGGEMSESYLTITGKGKISFEVDFPKENLDTNLQFEIRNPSFICDTMLITDEVSKNAIWDNTWVK